MGEHGERLVVTTLLGALKMTPWKVDTDVCGEKENDLLSRCVFK